MKKIYCFLTAVILTGVAQAQKIDYKKGKLTVDGKEVLSFSKKKMYDEYTFYKLNTTDEVIFISYERNGTLSYYGDDYTKIVFTQLNIRVEFKAIGFGLSGKPVMLQLVQDKVLLPDGTIDEEKAKQFFTKYHEVIEK